ncbi:MAG: DMT family transporter [Phycisphaerales bacterium]|nr:DMT family transporter [Phycisphaerales bacterium]
MTSTFIPRPWLGVLALLACATLWSMNGPLIKILNRPDAMDRALRLFGFSGTSGLDAPPPDTEPSDSAPPDSAPSDSATSAAAPVAPAATRDAGPGAAVGADAQIAATDKTQHEVRPVSPWTIASYRSLLGAAIFVPLAWPHRGTLRRVKLRWILAGVILFILMTTTFVVANTLTTASNAIVLQYTAPLVVFALSPLVLGERPSAGEGWVLLIVLVGVGVIFFAQPAGDTLGLVISLSSGLWYGALTVALRGLREVDARVVVGMNTLCSGLVLLPLVALYGSFSVTPFQLAMLALLGIAQFATPYLLFSYGVRHVEAHRASLITLLEVFLNPLLTWLVVAEAPGSATLLGGPIIVLGVVAWIFATLRRRSAHKRQ